MGWRRWTYSPWSNPNDHPEIKTTTGLHQREQRPQRKGQGRPKCEEHHNQQTVNLRQRQTSKRSVLEGVKTSTVVSTLIPPGHFTELPDLPVYPFTSDPQLLCRIFCSLSATRGAIDLVGKATSTVGEAWGRNSSPELCEHKQCLRLQHRTASSRTVVTSSNLCNAPPTGLYPSRPEHWMGT